MRDAHFHIAEPYSLMPKAEYAAPTLENAAYIIRAMEALGYAQVAIPSISLFDPVDFVMNPLTLYCKTLSPGRVFALGGLRYALSREENTDLAAQARKLVAAGFDGIKMICKPNARRTMHFPVDDAMFDEFFSFAEETRLPILYHVGDPETFWDSARVPAWARANGWYYGEDRDVPTMKEMWDEVERMLDKHPCLRVAFAHFLFLSEDLTRAQTLFDRYEGVSLDLTPGSEMFFGFAGDRDAARVFFERNSKRLLFGTDNMAVRDEIADQTLAEAKRHIARIRTFYASDCPSDWYPAGLKLSDAALNDIFDGNFTRFFGASPKRVDPDAAAALCGELRMTAAGVGAFRESLEALYGELARRFLENS